MSFTILTTRRGREAVAYDGYLYHKGFTRKDGVTSWHCSRSKIIPCRARLVTRLEDDEQKITEVVGVHIHEECPESIENLKSRIERKALKKKKRTQARLFVSTRRPNLRPAAAWRKAGGRDGRESDREAEPRHPFRRLHLRRAAAWRSRADRDSDVEEPRDWSRRPEHRRAAAARTRARKGSDVEEPRDWSRRPETRRAAAGRSRAAQIRHSD